MSPRMQNQVERGQRITIEVNGDPLPCYEGETVATALLAAGHVAFRRDRDGAPRGPVCNMGVCFECLLPIASPASDRFIRRRACMTAVRPGMRIRTGER